MADRRFGSKGRAAALAFALAGGVSLAAVSLQQPVAAQPQQAAPRAGGQLASFKSDADFLAFLQKRRAERQERMANEPVPPPPPPVSAPSPMAAQEAASADSMVVTGSVARSDKITNTQEADIDEGGIVKKRGGG